MKQRRYEGEKTPERSARRRRARGRLTASFAVFGVIVAGTVGLPGLSTPVASADGPPAACAAAPVVQSTGSAFSANETLCRVFFDKGVVDQRQFSVNVSNTAELRNRQVINVSWTGAHPTGGTVSAEQFAAASSQEYPVMLMECRGVDSANVPPAQQLSPETCWTATPDERTAWASSNPLWSLDMFNSAANQAPDVNTPPGDPNGCGEPGNDQYWVPYVGADGTNYPIGPDNCSGSMPPEMNNQTASQQLQSSSIIPSDTTYAQSDANGNGSVNFTVETALANATLGCSDAVPCSLVVIPIEGISCAANPPTGQAYSQCESTGTFKPGEPGYQQPNPAPAVTAHYWWSGSNWSRRISVPLSFAQEGNVCANNASSTPVGLYGSELMAQATQQWDPHFCLDPKLFPVNHVQTPEPQAKNLLQAGSIEAAIQGEPPPVDPSQPSFFTTPTVQAPIAVSGFAISYVVDNSDGKPYRSLRLDARLLAKLMTESYPGTNNVASGDTAIGQNPVAIFNDPEFLALNPSYKVPGYPISPESAPAATLFSILSNSDVLWALTSYINADPEARAWLDGRVDPWGMVVNPAYKGVQLPVDNWPLLDTSTQGPDYIQGGTNPCLANAKPASRVPDRPLIDNPQNTLGQVAYNLQFSIAASQVICNYDPTGNLYNMVALGPEQIGARFLLGLVSLPAAEQFGLDTAALQTFVSAGAPTKFTDPSNRVFTAPSDASLKAAAALLKPDPASGSWQLPYSDFASNPAVAGAYPGTMLLSLDVPTTGLPSGDATKLGEYLNFAAGAGQARGNGVGQIPAGYLPLTDANGLAQELAYTKAAAADVSAQNATVPPLVPGSGGASPKSGGNSSGPGTTGSTGGLGPVGQAVGTSAGQTGPALSALNARGRGGSPSLFQSVANVGRTLVSGAGLGGLALPIALGLALASGGITGSGLWQRRRRSAS